VEGAEDPVGDAPFDSLLSRPDLDALDAWLDAAGDAQLRRANAWHREHKAALLEFEPDDAADIRRARTWTSTLLVASTAAPGEAVKQLDWNDWWFVHDDERALLRRALLRRPREWAAAFVPSAAKVKLGRRREPSTAAFLFLMLDPLVRHHELPLPDGDAFLNGWARLGSRPDGYLPHLLGPVLSSSHLRHRPDLPAVIAASVAAGEIARAAVVAAALEALVAPLQPSAQRVLADVLVTLALTPAELAGRLPLLQSSLATAYGSITAVLLPLAVSLTSDAADLDEIAAVVAGRGEKRQRITLLDLLQDRDLRVRVGDDAVLGALDHLDACDDAALRERVARCRRTLAAPDDATVMSDVDADVEAADPAPSPAHDGMWTPMVREGLPVAGPLQLPAQLELADVFRLLGERSSAQHFASLGRVNRSGHATLLECLVRAAAADPAAVRAMLATHGNAAWLGLEPVAGAIICWVRGDLDGGPVYDARIPGHFYADAVVQWRPRERVMNAAAREALWRAGRVPTVLSTPSVSDGTLHLDAVLRRIESGQVPSYTPYDMTQVLLRLPVVSSEDRARMERLGDLALPADPACWAEHARHQGRPDTAPPDGVELIRRWVDEGGLRPLDATWELTDGFGPFGGIGWDWGDEPPLPTGVLDSLLVDLADLADGTSTPTAVTLAPCWPDLAAASLWAHSRGDSRADIILEGPGPRGTPSHAVALAPLAGPPERQRQAVQGLLELVRRDTLSAPHLRHAVEVLNHAGALPLRRVAQGLEQAFVGGGLADLWPVALGITADASVHRPLPSGLPDLLRLLAAYLPAVPDRDLPVELTGLAAARGTSKSHAEARALLAVQGAS
jgi:hypothetical protein